MKEKKIDKCDNVWLALACQKTSKVYRNINEIPDGKFTMQNYKM